MFLEYTNQRLNSPHANKKTRGSGLFSQWMTLWNELENYTKLATCTYGAAKKMTKMLEEEKVH